MTIQEDFTAFQAFQSAEGSASLWVFKKRPIADDANPFRAVSVMMSEELEAELRAVVYGYQQTFGEASPYNLLAQTNEGGFLGASKAETLFPELEELVNQPAHEHQITSVKQLNNAAGYVFRIRVGDAVLYCAKKASPDWATKKKNGMMSLLFKDATLDIQDAPSFSIARSFDFFALNESILMANKAAFESLLNHKATYVEDFAALRVQPNFVAVFSNLEHVVAYVGNNAIQLRRMTEIKKRAYYNNAGYMQRLREVSALRGWGIAFDADGKISPTAETVKDIIQVLLDHRLRSELSEKQYDVPSTIPVN